MILTFIQKQEVVIESQSDTKPKGKKKTVTHQLIKSNRQRN